MLLLILFCFYEIYYTSYFLGRNISSDMLMHMFVNYLLGTLVFVVPISPPYVVFVFVAPPELLARPPPRGDCLLHALPSLYPFDRPALKPLGHGFVPPAGVLRRRSCGRTAGGDGGWLVGKWGLPRRASVWAFSHSCASRSCAPLIPPRIGAPRRCTALLVEARTPCTGGCPVFEAVERRRRRS